MGSSESIEMRAEEAGIALPETDDHASPWRFYDHLIEGIPEGIQVKDYCLGTHWSYLEAECGMGVGWTCKGGAPRSVKTDLRAHQLRDVARLVKSWCFEEATLGVAALNAWYSRPALLDEMGVVYDEPIEQSDGTRRKTDAFEMWRPRIEESHPNKDANVVVVGHFPHVDRIQDFANLTVLERNCTNPLDTPDPACEYVMPTADYAFITGVTIINKTCPRLLDLAQDATVIMVGPSVIMSPLLFRWGVDAIAGSVVADPERTRFAVKAGAGQLFGEALQMAMLEIPAL